MWEEYLYPKTVEEALSMLAESGGAARVIAGGTDLVLQLRRGERRARMLIDITRIKELRRIVEDGSAVVIGAAATHAEVAASPIIRRRAAVLAHAAAEVGSPELRNTATIGGNVVNAQPAADTALALLALDAEVEVVRPGEKEWVSLGDLYAGPGRSEVDSTAELVRSLRFRPPTGRVGTAYRRLGKCKSIALPVLCAAAVVVLDEDRFASTAIALGPVGPGPTRAASADQWLVGRSASAESVRRAAALAQRDAAPRNSLLRCTRVYREAMVGVVVRSVLEASVAAARRGDTA